MLDHSWASARAVCMLDGMLDDWHRDATPDLVTWYQRTGTMAILNSRTQAATPDSDVLDSTAADLPLGT